MSVVQGPPSVVVRYGGPSRLTRWPQANGVGGLTEPRPVVKDQEELLAGMNEYIKGDLPPSQYGTGRTPSHTGEVVEHVNVRNGDGDITSGVTDIRKGSVGKQQIPKQRAK